MVLLYLHVYVVVEEPNIDISVLLLLKYLR